MEPPRHLYLLASLMICTPLSSLQQVGKLWHKAFLWMAILWKAGGIFIYFIYFCSSVKDEGCWTGCFEENRGHIHAVSLLRSQHRTQPLALLSESLWGEYNESISPLIVLVQELWCYYIFALRTEAQMKSRVAEYKFAFSFWSWSWMTNMFPLVLNVREMDSL